MSKVDIRVAFKQCCPIHPSLWCLHGFKWNDLYYFYTRLVFGSRSSPKIFDTLSQAICWIIEHHFDVQHILHLLDDFLTIDSPEGTDAERTMAIITLVFNKLHIDLSSEKTVGPATLLEYLGIILDTILMQARLPEDKLTRLKALVKLFLTRDTCRRSEMESLVGHLNFACRVVVPGRSFISLLLQAMKQAKRPHGQVYIDSECKADLYMWQYFLSKWNGISLFLENETTTADRLDLFTDASDWGFGGYYKGDYFYDSWPHDLLTQVEREGKLSMSFKELYPIVVAAILWGKYWKRKRIVFHCDNIGTVHILKKGEIPIQCNNETSTKIGLGSG